ncbi:MAG: leucine-rich repeat protein [Bacteroidales bacterium]|nr:leucine-rich repeat protein [Bacteroidales bacterium]
MSCVSQIFIRGPKEAVNKLLKEAIPDVFAKEVKTVKEDGADITVLLCLGEEEWIEFHTWADENKKSTSFEELVSLYGVTIFEDVYNTEYEDDYFQTTIIEPGDGAPKTTVIEPRHTLYGFENAFTKLIEYDPERYRQVKIKALEALSDIIHRDINEEKIKLVLERATADNGRVFIPKDVTEIEPYDFKGFPIESIEADPKNPVYCAKGNCLLSKDGKRVIIGCKNSVIPEGVTEIGYDAFAGCKELESINVPEDVKIWHGAFDGCPCAAEFVNRYVVDDTNWINDLF